MKSRHMSVMHSVSHRRLLRALPWLGAFLLFFVAAAASAQETGDPPGRVGVISFRQGSVVFAPQGEEEWVELPQNRPITSGDRIWTDRGARAELQMGTSSVHIDGETHLGVSDLDDRATQLILQQGTANARVRDIASGENFEIGTPNLAFRALQAGDYRIDVDTQTGQTRVTVQSGLAQLFGEGGGQSINMGPGQQATFGGRFLAQVRTDSYALDDFSLWAAERNRVEDQSVAARHVPRGVVGYSQLDQNGQWVQDANHGAIWYPQVPVADWAPYRYGHWEWIGPWGWTWMDDAPWGFAPFHYGRWTMIGDRWAWVPGQMTVRPVYSPALVVFLGGVETGFSINALPAVGWYPLAPGEAWYPVFRSSPRYVSFANFNINLNTHPRNATNHFWRNHTHAITAVPQDDFRRGRPVYRHWQPLQPRVIGAAQIGVVPARPERERIRRIDGQLQPRFNGAAPAPGAQPTAPRQFFGARERDAAPAVREQFRAQQDQQRLQREAERTAREQQHQQDATRQQGDLRAQREQMLRQQQEQAARIGAERGQREGIVRAPQDRAQREGWQQHQQERMQQREAWQHQREQDRAQRQQHAEPPRVVQQPVAPVVQQQPVAPVMQAPRAVQRIIPQVAPATPQVQSQQAAPIGESRGQGGWHRSGGDSDDGRGRGGHGGGRWQR